MKKISLLAPIFSLCLLASCARAEDTEAEAQAPEEPKVVPLKPIAAEQRLKPDNDNPIREDGDPSAPKPEGIVIEKPAIYSPPFRHAVFFKFNDKITAHDLQGIIDSFILLKDSIPEIIDIEWGFSESVEGLNDDFSHAFLLTFKDKEALTTYLDHPDHVEFTKLVKPHLEKAFVFDYTVRD